MMIHTKPLKLLVCLGNPGREYQNTRHNAGWMTADRLLEEAGSKPVEASWQPSRGLLLWTRLAGRSILLLKPLTFMNLSGEAVAETLGHFRITPAEMLVVCDDLDIPEGSLRAKRKGSSGGHRGLESIIQNLQTTDFPRLRVGIGRPRPETGITIVDWVLAPWVSADQSLPRDAIRAAVQILGVIESGDFEKAAREARMAGNRWTESNRS